LADDVQQVDLDEVGVDAHATEHLGAEAARRLAVVPIRVLGDLVVVAAGHTMDSVEVAELSREIGKQVRLVTVEPGQIDAALRTYYASSPVAA
jgi:hypothetical protein